MPTFNQGIRTNAGYDLFGRTQSGQTKIHYTKVVFSSLDLSNKTDDEIQNMTDVNPKELIIPNLQVLYKPKTSTSDQETEIRAIGSNEILKKGFYINTYALYAADDKGNEILYGVTADNNPSWLPAYDGVRPQALTYNWDTGDKDTNNVHFTDSHDAYATYGDYQDFSKNINDMLNQVTLYKGDLQSTDLNTATIIGGYTIAGINLQHAPSDATEPFWGNVQITPAPSGVRQILYDNNDNNAIYSRVIGAYNNKQFFNDWIRLSNDGDLKNISESIKSAFNQSTSYIDSKINKLYSKLNPYKGSLPDVDLNKDTSPGIFLIEGNTLQNGPQSINLNVFYGQLHNIQGSNGTRRQLLYSNNNNNAVCTRVCLPNVWYNPWVKLTND